MGLGSWWRVRAKDDASTPAPAPPTEQDVLAALNRVNAMLAARTNVRDTLEELTQSYRRVRQDEITDDIAELAAATTQPV